MSQIGFLQGPDGENSVSRLMAVICISAGLLIAFMFIAVGLWSPTTALMPIATAIGVAFGAIAGTAMTFLFFQKQTETKAIEAKEQIKLAEAKEQPCKE